jgi:hypothetical protein
MDKALNAFMAMVGGFITLAILAVIVSRNAQTPAVVQSTGGALATVINAAVSPVTNGGGSNGNNAFSTPAIFSGGALGSLLDL